MQTQTFKYLITKINLLITAFKNNGSHIQEPIGNLSGSKIENYALTIIRLNNDFMFDSEISETNFY